MRKITLLLLSVCICLASLAQKKGKTKDDSKDKDKSKGKAKTEKVVSTNYVDPEPVADTATKFIGVIKYLITTDDPADKDSMFIIFGENKIRVTMYYPGYKEGDIFQDNMIANFSDSTFIEINNRTKTYTTEKLGLKNNGTTITLANSKKTAQILKYVCQEYSGDMTLKEGDSFQAAALISKQHSYINIADYNFMNIQPVVLGYKIVLGWRTKTPDNETTFIMAYKIEPGNVDPYFDLSGFKAK